MVTEIFRIAEMFARATLFIALLVVCFQVGCQFRVLALSSTLADHITCTPLTDFLSLTNSSPRGTVI